MSFDAGKTVRERLGDEFLFEVFAWQAECCIHERAASRLCMAAVEAVGAIDCLIEDFCFLLIAARHFREAALRLDPCSDLADHVDAEDRRRVVERVLLVERRVAQHRWQLVRVPFEQRFLCDDEDDAGRTEVLLHARVNEVELLEVDRSREHVGRHIGKERNAVCLRHVVVLRAVNRVVVTDVEVGSVRRDLFLLRDVLVAALFARCSNRADAQVLRLFVRLFCEAAREDVGTLMRP